VFYQSYSIKLDHCGSKLEMYIIRDFAQMLKHIC